MFFLESKTSRMSTQTGQKSLTSTNQLNQLQTIAIRGKNQRLNWQKVEMIKDFTLKITIDNHSRTLFLSKKSKIAVVSTIVDLFVKAIIIHFMHKFLNL